MSVIILTLLMAWLLAGCQAPSSGASRQEKTTPQPVGRPAWFNAELPNGSPALEQAQAYLNQVFQGSDPIRPSHFIKAQSLVNAALATESNTESLQEASIILGHAALLAMAHEQKELGIQNQAQLRDLLLSAARLKAVRQSHAELFASWLADLVAWEEAHDDWSALRLASQFEDTTPLGTMPELWMARPHQGTNLATESLPQWRNAKPTAKRLNDFSSQETNRSWWLMQSIEKPEVQEGMDTLAVFSAFRGRCTVFVNGVQSAQLDSEGPHYFTIPLDFSTEPCTVVIHFPEGAPAQHAPWPIWLVARKTPVKDRS